MSAETSPAEPVIAMIAARARNGVIGRDGTLPWRLPEDLRFFKRVTMGKPVLMGRRTWQSIGRPLPGRTNIVVSRDPAFRAPGAVLASDLAAGLAAARAAAREAGAAEIMVIGGAALYAALLPQAGRLYLTEIDAEIEGDTRFPEVPAAEWRRVSSEPGEAAGSAPFPYRFEVWERVAPPAEPI